MSSPMPDCTSKCRSLKHALDVLSVVTKGSENQIKAFLSSHCYNAATIKDVFGRNALHLVSSCGKKGVLDWLIQKGVDLLVKDKESGWTALHRSIFYGHIDCVWSLLKHGVSLYIQDKEGLSALDLVMKDRPTHVVFKNTDPTDVYTWGDNTNFTLGHGSQNSKHHPELVDLFSRSGIYIKQVVLCKFHSVFLSQKGQVYTCGHGPGGRLGHGDEQTCLVPRLVEGLNGHNCSQVAAAKDHTVVLTEDGCVYTFGLNIFHQLGIIPPPSSCNVPRQIQAKYLKGRTIIGVAAGRFHTVLWTREAVYTMGLNGGQLGCLLDPNGEKCVTAPRQVSALHHKDIALSLVAASDGATVCVTTRGDIYLLADYQCKKMASKQLNLKKVLVSGGHMEYKVDPEHLKENGGQKICILAMDGAGRVFCWRSVNSSLKQCRWAYPRQVFISDIALNRNEILFVTQDGEGFRGRWFEEKRKSSEKKEILSNLHNSSSDVSYVSDINSVYERIRLEKLTFAHRAVSVSTDPSGCNFAILQSDPKTSLYEIPAVSSSSFFEEFGKLLREADEMDSIHDVTFQVGNRLFPAHKYILAVHSDFFQKLFLSDGNTSEFTDIYQKDEDSAGCHLFVVEKVHPDMFEYLLQFIYTDTCDFLTHGFKPRIHLNKNPEEYQGTLNSHLNKVNFHEDDNQKSAFEVYKSNQAQTVSERQKSKPKSCKKGKNIREDDPVRMLQTVAKKFDFSNLSSRLDGVRFENEKINVIAKNTGNKLKLSQKKCSFLCDVTMKSVDGKEFPCHKCVLCARLEYFHSMLSSSWIEASSCAALEMPIHSDILKVILDYLYTDEAVVIKESQNVDFICSVLVVADQLLITRLKEICEVALTEKLTLKNAAMLLEFAAMYSAKQLKLSCLQFIGLNMAALLEARSLDVLSDGVLKDLSEFYRKMIPAMDRRVITPYQDGPDISYLEVEDGDIFLKEEINMEQNHSETMFKKAKTKAKKKPRKRSDSSGGYNLSDIIQSPSSTGLLKSGKTNSVESLPELLTSDSEGSYAGVGSPRDLQSPDFTTGFHSDKIEAKVKPYVNGTSPVYSREDLKPWEKSPILKISAPQPIPSNRIDTTSSASWVAGSFSPVSPPVVDLRTIMEIEESRQKCGATPKSHLGKTVSHGVKLSQKQRKMIALTTKENNSGMNSMETVLFTPSKAPKPVNAWASSLHSVSSKSFRDFLLEEKKSVTSHSSGDHVKKVSFKGIENSQAPKIVRCSTHGTPGPEGNHISDLPLLDSPNPWLSSSVTAPSMVAPVTFASIVEEELQQEAALIRSREKPLALIQIEEHAIQDLLVFYEAFGNPEEFVIVERTPQGPLAVPMWNKHGC
ncbi:inhibitor of Bruton tyrosine kinase [Homo sapiens]|uniref:Inhibitor of Bruton tyrosine kinase n=1 Tax=Homo sapiens TaxID=9606 RepID=IBTK_HUMAN|nr:inhibitor of Bruton tyrosine kinase isoform 1 [Homo sapiens]Q9P2D0.3 RecName: Full=Inhibitor of Bruton tyrosine kinase; Short=IBtk [Homo sapiens]AAI13697.1 Inhibitor of Bruton agammaglobulinemia tyrosine kinase [Homo sapiens]AAI13699.1 Inhibitor of Bruton agammaglobulinemia tyrosine kinase [Homo sapiens]AAY55906.1 inhibitor of Bruton's tyrosine kinase-alpha [Homo sapiens]EAW48685.1 inhibitor of Bruton agammaglobulinemia tyrosine kinase, isoform CRA_a [Homo sapiens]KAI2543022.1 inhibitor of|eukprot:NP_056340.2 inhibitor of Bruton tyrosine kinase isoform 1 [Homo sapiens]